MEGSIIVRVIAGLLAVAFAGVIVMRRKAKV
jgi:hypothetical protein